MKAPSFVCERASVRQLGPWAGIEALAKASGWRSAHPYMNLLLLGSLDKTNEFLHHMLNDLEHSFLLLDPTGEMAPKLADRIPASDTQRIFYFDPADRERPAGFNVLEGIAPEYRSGAVEDICSIFDAVFASGEATLARENARFVLSNSLRLLLDDNKGHTLLAVLKILSDTSFRDELLARCSDPVVRSNWSAIAAENLFENAIALLFAKIGTLFMDPVVRNILGQRHSSFSPTKERKIIIVSLNRQALGDTPAMILGGLLLARYPDVAYIPNTSFFPPSFIAGLLRRENLVLDYTTLPDPQRYRAMHRELLRSKILAFHSLSASDSEDVARLWGMPSPKTHQLLFRTNLEQAIEEPSPSLNRLRAIRKRSRACHTRPRVNVEKEIERFLG